MSSRRWMVGLAGVVLGATALIVLQTDEPEQAPPTPPAMPDAGADGGPPPPATAWGGTDEGDARTHTMTQAGLRVGLVIDAGLPDSGLPDPDLPDATPPEPVPDAAPPSPGPTDGGNDSGVPAVRAH